MPWIRIDENAFEHPKFRAITDGAWRLWGEGQAYCQKYLTDGVIPNEALKLFHYYSPKRRQILTAVLIPGKGPLWHEIDGGIQVHDFLDWNDSREHVLMARQYAKERLGKFRGKQRVASGVGATRFKRAGTCTDATVSTPLHTTVPPNKERSEVPPPPKEPKERPLWKGEVITWFQFMEDDCRKALKLAQREDFDLHEWRARLDREWATQGIKPQPGAEFKPIMARLIADVPLQQPTLKVRPVASQVPQYTTTVPDGEAAQRRRLLAEYEADCTMRVQVYLDSLPAQEYAALSAAAEQTFRADHPEYNGRLSDEQLREAARASLRRDKAIRSKVRLPSFAEYRERVQGEGVGVS